ncbi:bacillithiol biosynthesis cysteine-adding enzyme BshC [Brevibacillus borstelensis]|uniref:bacillithiol biosynthesis cysteine-adding enzyme BshC n=1 Tax=Brevibacillus TaxID=55080 RepID=UPI00203F2913|nr:bacillithiol biosynthesis cysteine-adding enzyme BshC [Brevibacillus borstelensis]MCM3622297.1 bacillithiol biosynthesis cysteine-adding enzyme BshC [Brevibacillus borstelensis]MED1850262.1 bacillithiol biosynthesis cysteine-adding enzyme BshC [Brevibacillus borstelensis]WNF07678.1 bacillithiol biosynthesis cysteine-adding enzyme BshC [Brevibacillus borstelensis]
MNVECVSLPLANRLAHDYQLGNADALRFFTYPPYQMESYRKRLEWLENNEIPHRDKLADGLLAYNQAIGNHQRAMEGIEKLRKQGTMVVIGGQQAGVLTGPLYTIYKAVHLIQAARQLSAQLNAEVVPVFWIAGEDHDIDEIDHTFWLTDQETKLHKEKISLPRTGRPSASSVPLGRAEYEAFMEKLFANLTETEETAAIRRWVEEAAASSKTVVDWFARLMASLFGKHGLILVESSLPFVRELEKPVFTQVLQRNEELSALVADAAGRLESAGYPLQLEVGGQEANLFLYEGKDRLQLLRHGDRFVTRRGTYTREEMIELAETDPCRFSSNVVTRSLMQEHLFPTLAFVAGAGEIAYWAYFKEVFAAFGKQLPIVLPRVSVTLVEGAIARLLKDFDLPIDKALASFAAWKEEWEASRGAHPLTDRFQHVRDAMQELYQPLVSEVALLEPGMEQLAEKNAARLLEQVDFLERRLVLALEQREDIGKRRLWRLEAALNPAGGLQERKLSIIPFVNKYGLSLVDRLVEAPLVHDGSHQVVYL